MVLTTLITSFPTSTPGNAQEIATRTPASERLSSVGRFERFEATFTVPGNYTNPYDPTQVDVRVTFVAPRGGSVEIPAFYLEQYRDICQGNCEAESLEAVGNGEWRVRFSPDEIGTWRYTVNATIGGESDVIQNGRFEVERSDAPGFIQVGENGHYFAFEDGTPYFPVGENLGWSWAAGGGIYTYLRWLDSLEAAGANYARINIDVPWFIGLEWALPPGQYGGEGQQAAWRFDQILEAAEERGIYLQVVLIWNQAFREFTGIPVTVPSSPARANTSSDFDNHPYNVRLGGNLQGPGDIFFNVNAQNWLKQRLRYIAARWGYSSHIFAWEIVDSFDRMAAFTAERDNVWLTQMIEALQAADPNDHLITVGTHSYQPVIEANPLLDFSQTQFYQARPIEQTVDQVRGTLAVLSETLARIERPVLLTEFSLNPWFEPTADDPTGIHIRNTLWATIFTGAAGSAMPWWWDTYIDPQNLYALYTPIALFTEGVPWNTSNFEPIQPGLVSEGEINYQPLRIDDFNRQFRSASPASNFLITADGSAPPTTQMSSYLYGKEFNATNSHPQTLIIAPPIATTLTIGIQNVSTAANAQLLVTIDGTTATSLDLSAGTGAATIMLPLTAGRHTVIFDNPGDDWLQLEYLEIADYLAPLRALALADVDEGIALVWIHHRDFTWEQVQANVSNAPLNFTLELPDMPVGEYRIEFWNPESGNIIGEAWATVEGETRGVLRTALLPIDSDLALRVFRMAGPDGAQVDVPAPVPTATDTPAELQPAAPQPQATATEIRNPAVSGTDAKQLPLDNEFE